MELPAPDEFTLSRKAEIVARLRAALPADVVIDDPAETKAYECDALSAYRCCLLYTSPSPRDLSTSRMPSSA